MVHGIERFREYFTDFTSQYVFIGGTACDILMDELGAPFRATKDLDVVLVVEALDKSFGEYFWKFVEAGGEDITRFIEQIKVDNPHLEGLGIRGITLDEMLAILKTIFS